MVSMMGVLRMPVLNVGRATTMTSFPAYGSPRQPVTFPHCNGTSVRVDGSCSGRRIPAKSISRKRASFFGGVVSVVLMASLAGAAPTDLDWHWDADGMLFPPRSGTGLIEKMVLQDEGSLVVATSDSHYEGSYLTRFDQFGGRDATFGNSGRVGPPQPAESPSSSYQVAGMTFRQDGRLDVQWYHLMRLTPG